VAAADIGLVQQARHFDALADRLGYAPPVIDAERFLRDPRGQMQALCAALGVDFSVRMLSWPPGPRASDGVWAPYWYDAVWNSTGFEPPRERTVRLDGDALRAAQTCRAAYERLRAHAM
jgi:hypothetical protein